MLVLSIDPGLSNVGWAIMDERDVYEYGLLQTSAKYKLHSRIKQIIRTLRVLLVRYDELEYIVMEDLTFGKMVPNQTMMINLAKVHGALQALPLPIRLVPAVSLMPKQKERDRRKKKWIAINTIRESFKIDLPYKDNHIADAILIGDYFLRKELGSHARKFRFKTDPTQKVSA